MLSRSRPAAAARGVEVTALSRYRQGAAVREGLQLGFAAVDSKEIRRGVRELTITLENELKTLHGSRSCEAVRAGHGICKGYPPT